MFKKNSNDISGLQLVNDFQNIAISRVTAHAAEQEAKQSEDVVLQQLSIASRGNFLNPANINEAEGDYVVRASVDAHIKKVQAEQLKSLTTLQLQDIMEKDKENYIGRKVRAISISKNFLPFDAVWFNRRDGYSSNEFKKKSVEGRITELDFQKNLIVIKPAKLSLFIYSNLQDFLVYIIDTETFTPAVELHLI